jgi:formyltetrahydrofolate deformylase
VPRVCHGNSIEEVFLQGSDAEKMELYRGLRYHLEDRALMYDNNPAIFD